MPPKKYGVWLVGKSGDRQDGFYIYRGDSLPENGEKIEVEREGDPSTRLLALVTAVTPELIHATAL
jgi:hypothetical protein